MLLGGALCFAGEYDEAVKNFRLAVRLSPHDPFTAFFFTYMAHAAMIGGRDDAALEWSLNIKEEKPTFPGGYRIGAVMLALAGRIEEARSDLQTYLELAPNTTIGDMREVLPIKHEAAMERYLGALKMAGMPE